jgi:hypothetical protein
MAHVGPPAAAIAQAALTVPGRRYDPAAARWVERHDCLAYSPRQRWRSPRLPDDGTRAFAAGLVPRVRAALSAVGYEVTLKYEATSLAASRPHADPDAVAKLHPALRPAVSGVAGDGPRLVALSRQLRLRDAVGPVIRAFPRARVVVVVPSRDDIRRWNRRLGDRVGRPVYSRETLRGHWGSDPKVLLVNDYLFGSCHGRDWDLAVVPDAARLLRSARPVYPVEECGIPAVGFVTRDFVPGDFERLRAEALFGAAEPIRSGSACGAITVLPLVVGRPVRPPPGNWRDRLWAHAERVACIGRVAHAYRCQDVATLSAHGLRPASAADRHPRVAVLAETVGQADRLGSCLAGWPVLSGTTATTTPPEAAVVTDGWRGQRSSAWFDVVIDARAADPVHAPPLPPASGILVDVRDDGDGELARRYHARVRAYAAAGYRIN